MRMRFCNIVSVKTSSHGKFPIFKGICRKGIACRNSISEQAFYIDIGSMIFIIYVAAIKHSEHSQTTHGI